MKSILVTGSEGFIGRQATVSLRRLGFNVSTLDILPGGENHFQADIFDVDLKAIFSEAKPEVIIHGAAQVSVPQSFVNPKRDLEVNGIGTLRVALAALESGCKNVVYLASGGAIYDSNEPMPLTEESRERAVSPYGASKNLGENYTRILSEKFKSSWTSLALSNVYGGPELCAKGVIYEFWKSLSNNQQPIINGAHVTRDFVHVNDVVRAIVLAIERPTNTRVNISSGTETSLIALFNLVKTILNVDLEPILLDPIVGDVQRSCLDNSLAKELLRWSPEIGLKEGLIQGLLGEN